jgi:hypothetical protein
MKTQLPATRGDKNTKKSDDSLPVRMQTQIDAASLISLSFLFLIHYTVGQKSI